MGTGGGGGEHGGPATRLSGLARGGTHEVLPRTPRAILVHCVPNFITPSISSSSSSTVQAIPVRDMVHGWGCRPPARLCLCSAPSRGSVPWCHPLLATAARPALREYGNRRRRDPRKGVPSARREGRAWTGTASRPPGAGSGGAQGGPSDWVSRKRAPVDQFEPSKPLTSGNGGARARPAAGFGRIRASPGIRRAGHPGPAAQRCRQVTGDHSLEARSVYLCLVVERSIEGAIWAARLRYGRRGIKTGVGGRPGQTPAPGRAGEACSRGWLVEGNFCTEMGAVPPPM